VTASKTSQRAVAALRDVLPRAARVRPGRSPRSVVVNGVPLSIEWVGEGWLRDVRSVVSRRRNRPDIVAAHRVSPGAAKALMDAGIGFVDEAGAAEIVVDSLIVSRTGHAPSRVRPKRWTPSVLAVAEALLCGITPTVSATQEATGLSSGSCTRALEVLTERGLLDAVAKRGRLSARRIVDREQLLAEYAAAAAAAPSGTSLQVGATFRDPVEGVLQLGRKWNKAGVAWAATGPVAAAALAPHLTGGASADVYVDARSLAGLASVAADAGLRAIPGGRLTLRPFPTVASRRLATEERGLRVAPWPRVYADLRPTGVRGEEAAEHLREVMTRG
jgi:hypothetical protein